MYLIDNRFIFGLLKEKMSGYYFDSVFQRAAAYLYLINLSFNNEESYNYQTKPNFENKSWGSEIFGTIKFISDKMRNDVVVENLHFEDFIKKYRLLVPSNHNIFLYADPPYWVANKSTYYNYVFTEEDHILLAELMHKMPNNIKFIISYDDVPQIRELYKDMFIETTNQYGYSMNTGTGDNQIKKIELLISNFKLSNKQESLL